MCKKNISIEHLLNGARCMSRLVSIISVIVDLVVINDN